MPLQPYSSSWDTGTTNADRVDAALAPSFVVIASYWNEGVAPLLSNSRSDENYDFVVLYSRLHPTLCKLPPPPELLPWTYWHLTGITNNTR
ncbi:hypothetical protein HBH56_233110 [Parastagonospora nodorum]|uniref:Uncharacterized protein n=1 Tax=Phaeosphaeria nodorum (strain SN15 / ATCC MYA-4574 / FGSC 10173) TaxID=321614 RepID=A0A7U2IDB4_PHANO|nr:hypothetical protein HBH56_233110 [Parastagonospora nodorum]QRD07688.1 hypothetical protein JI435_448020 [Parastagonospora nodorum SN15]KAH3921403.1 hypothetical protein HBH54_239950 [Parastagonospora nodorum]KAH3939969.1 hypothetical protein HBH53_226190 [Parastagonospora nodorum]KAH3994056.1 hypothetical protein HBI10_193800 [Parastagonospora nodorum]